MVMDMNRMLQVFATPKQREALQQMKVLTKNITATITKREDGIIVVLKTDDSQAQQVLPQISEALVNSVGQTLNSFFEITGEIIDGQ